MRFFIITALPFRKYGNQSMLRFVKMLLNNGNKVTLITSGHDEGGENEVEHANLFIIRKKTLIRNIIERIFSRHANKVIDKASNSYINLKSNDIIQTLDTSSLKTLLKRWLLFCMVVADNFCMFLFVLFYQRKTIRLTKTIIAYERGYPFCCKWLSGVCRKKYINKYQGTLLKSTNRSLLKRLVFFPTEYFTINKSDLTIMVNDGTDGEYYAQKRGCKNTLFITHGVSKNDYKEAPRLLDNSSNKKITFCNIASASRWKRVDRIIRALSHLNGEILDKIEIVTTYNGYDLNLLKDLANHYHVQDVIKFVGKITHQECNNYIRNSKLLLSTNDLSNLGNPVLEAIYYGVPVLSVDDGSLDGFLKNDYDAILLKLSDDFDKQMASAINRVIVDKEYYIKLKKNIANNTMVKSLKEQQVIEYSKITEELVS